MLEKIFSKNEPEMVEGGTSPLKDSVLDHYHAQNLQTGFFYR